MNSAGPVVWASSIAITCVLLVVFQKVLFLVVPFLLALILFYILYPVTHRLVVAGMTREAAASVVTVLFLVLLLLGGLLYLGSGVGLGVIRLIRDRGWKSPGLTKTEWGWLLGAIAFGGMLGPVALLFGLTQTSGATASLLLNLEAVLTAVIAWLIDAERP